VDVPTYVVAGCLTLDAVVTASGELIPRTCGGNALYAAVGASAWSRDVGLVARAGGDYPDACLATIGGVIDTAGVRRLPGPHPLHVAFAYGADGSRSRRIPTAVLASIPPELRDDLADDTHSDERYLDGTPTPDEIPAAWLAEMRGCHIPALLAGSQRRLIDAIRAARPGCLVTVDAPWYARRDGTTEEPDRLEAVDAVLPSEEDLERFRPGVGLLEAARELIGGGARAVVVKLGALGSIVVDRRGKVTHVPAYRARVVDPTGAGDAYCGGFLVGLHETGDLVEAAVCGTAAASFVVEERSALPLLGVERAAAEERASSIRSGVRRGIESDPRTAG
jgi:sugar/nucleoside kinase (ribokinase family)